MSERENSNRDLFKTIIFSWLIRKQTAEWGNAKKKLKEMQSHAYAHLIGPQFVFFFTLPLHDDDDDDDKSENKRKKRILFIMDLDDLY